MKTNEILRECHKLAKEQGLSFRRSKSVNTINGKACYEIESGIEYKVLHKGCLNTIWDTLLSENLKGQ